MEKLSNLCINDNGNVAGPLRIVIKLFKEDTVNVDERTTTLNNVIIHEKLFLYDWNHVYVKNCYKEKDDIVESGSSKASNNLTKFLKALGFLNHCYFL